MKKFAKFFKLLPLISIPIWMTFPAAFNVYWIVTTSCNVVVSNILRITKVRKAAGIPDFLPGSKLERLNVKKAHEVFKPKFYTKAQVTKMKLEKAK